MPEETTNADDQVAVVVAPGVLAADSDGLLAAVEDRVKERTEAGDVLEDAVNSLVDGRINRRSALLKNALERVKKLKKEEAKIKPNAKGYTKDGDEVAGEVFSKNQVDRIKQIQKELEPIVAAIAAQDFDKLSKLGF